MSKLLRVLNIEDSIEDSLLLERELEQHGYQVVLERVDRADAMRAALEKQSWDIIISDYVLPQFSAPDALETIKQSGLDLPFIILSGTISEDIAVESLRAGAHDFMSKQKMARLAPAIERELREAQGRNERRRADEQLRLQYQRISALHAISLAITSSFDLHVTLIALLDQVTSQLHVDAARVLLLNPNFHKLEQAASRGLRAKTIVQHQIRIGEGYAGRAVMERQTIAYPSLNHDDPEFARSEFLQGEDFAAYFGVPLISKGEIKGVLEVFHRTSLTPDSNWLEFLEALASQAAVAIDSATLFQKLERSNVELGIAYDETIEGWSRAIVLRNGENPEYIDRVIEMSLQLAQNMGVSAGDQVNMRRGILLHDIGMMGVPESVLLKAGALTEAERRIVRQHPEFAHQILAPIAYFRTAMEIPYCHHEKWDGTGYPRGLMGEQIPLAARIFSIVDVWDALRSERPYRTALAETSALAIILEQDGKHFDPRVTQEFLRLSKNQ